MYISEDFRRSSHNFMYESVGDFKTNVTKACQNPSEIIQVNIYPTKDWYFEVDRDLACQN